MEKRVVGETGEGEAKKKLLERFELRRLFGFGL